MRNIEADEETREERERRTERVSKVFFFFSVNFKYGVISSSITEPMIAYGLKRSPRLPSSLHFCDSSSTPSLSVPFPPSDTLTDIILSLPLSHFLFSSPVPQSFSPSTVSAICHSRLLVWPQGSGDCALTCGCHGVTADRRRCRRDSGEPTTHLSAALHSKSRRTSAPHTPATHSWNFWLHFVLRFGKYSIVFLLVSPCLSPFLFFPALALSSELPVALIVLQT